MMRSRTILLATSALLIAVCAGTSSAQQPRRGDEQPRAGQTMQDRPGRQSDADRPRDGGGPRSERVAPADRPGPDIERLKRFLDDNPQARRELMQYLRQRAQEDQDRPQRAERDRQPQRQTETDRRLWEDRPQLDPQRLRELLRDNPQARERLRELVERRPELRGRVAEFLRENPDALRRLMQQQRDRLRPQAEPRPMQPRGQARPGLRAPRDQQLTPRYDPRSFHEFLRAYPRVHELYRDFVHLGQRQGDRGYRGQFDDELRRGPGMMQPDPRRFACPCCCEPRAPRGRPHRDFEGRPGRAR